MHTNAYLTLIINFLHRLYSFCANIHLSTFICNVKVYLCFWLSFIITGNYIDILYNKISSKIVKFNFLSCG